MQIITINLPEKYLDAIQVLNNHKIYPSRSEAIRVALDRFLTNEIKMDKELNQENFKLLTKSRIKSKKSMRN
jgi:Arc/MetJ-type ribon-helix-helix transcriptional regulator